MAKWKSIANGEMEKITKQIVITMTINHNPRYVNNRMLQLQTLETKLEVNDLGNSEVPEELFKEDDKTDGEMEKNIFDLVKPYFEQFGGIPIIDEGHRNDKKI